MFGAYNAGPARYAAHLRTGAALPVETQTYIAALARTPRSVNLPPAVLSGTLLFFRLNPAGAGADSSAGPAPSGGLFAPLGTRAEKDEGG